MPFKGNHCFKSAFTIISSCVSLFVFLFALLSHSGWAAALLLPTEARIYTYAFRAHEPDPNSRCLASLKFNGFSKNLKAGPFVFVRHIRLRGNTLRILIGIIGSENVNAVQDSLRTRRAVERHAGFLYVGTYDPEQSAFMWNLNTEVVLRCPKHTYHIPVGRAFAPLFAKERLKAWKKMSADELANAMCITRKLLCPKAADLVKHDVEVLLKGRIDLDVFGWGYTLMGHYSGKRKRISRRELCTRLGKALKNATPLPTEFVYKLPIEADLPTLLSVFKAAGTDEYLAAYRNFLYQRICLNQKVGMVLTKDGKLLVLNKDKLKSFDRVLLFVSDDDWRLNTQLLCRSEYIDGELCDKIIKAVSKLVKGEMLLRSVSDKSYVLSMALDPVVAYYRELFDYYRNLGLNEQELLGILVGTYYSETTPAGLATFSAHGRDWELVGIPSALGPYAPAVELHRNKEGICKNRALSFAALLYHLGITDGFCIVQSLKPRNHTWVEFYLGKDKHIWENGVVYKASVTKPLPKLLRNMICGHGCIIISRSCYDPEAHLWLIRRNHMQRR